MIRWLAALLFVGLWTFIAAHNDWWLWRKLVRREEKVPSTAPLIGAIFAYLAYRVLPIEEGLRLPILLAMLVLDFGSLPYGLAMIVALIGQKLRR